MKEQRTESRVHFLRLNVPPLMETIWDSSPLPCQATRHQRQPKQCDHSTSWVATAMRAAHGDDLIAGRDEDKSGQTVNLVLSKTSDGCQNQCPISKCIISRHSLGRTCWKVGKQRLEGLQNWVNGPILCTKAFWLRAKWGNRIMRLFSNEVIFLL